MKIAIVGVLALAATVVQAHFHHSVRQVAFDDLYHDCIGCSQKNNWFCGKRDSANFGKCSDKAFADCTGATWQGGLDGMSQCAALFALQETDIYWPQNGQVSISGKTITYTAEKITVNKPNPGMYFHMTINNDDYINRNRVAVQVPTNAAIYTAGTTFTSFTKVSGKTVTIAPE